MPITFKPLPPDHPIFTRGVGLVFRHEPPVDEAEEEESDSDEVEEVRLDVMTDSHQSG
jgi:hypothetical protein